MGCVSSRPAPPQKPIVKDLAAWNLWADLDLRDEQEMMHLAKLLDALMEVVPDEPEDGNVPGDNADDAQAARTSRSLTSGDLDIEKLEVHGRTYFAFSCQLGQQMTGTAELRQAADDLRDNYTRLLCNEPGGAQATDAESTDTQAIGASVSFGVEPPASPARQNSLHVTSSHPVSPHAAVELLRDATELLRHQPNVVPITVPRGSKLTVVGDLHGGLADLLHILNTCGMPAPCTGAAAAAAAADATGDIAGTHTLDAAGKPDAVIGTGHILLFNGDFVDRGEHGLEVLLMLVTLKLAYPEQVYLNRGNHEDMAVNKIYSFANEVARKCGSVRSAETVLAAVGSLWRALPLAHTINGRVIVLHGMVPFHDVGTSSWRSPTIAEINTVDRQRFSKSVDVTSTQPNMFLIKQILWADPESADSASEVAGNSKALRQGGSSGSVWGSPSSRVADSNLRNARAAAVADFLRTNDLSLLVRSHEAVYAGYLWNYGPSDVEKLSPGPYAAANLGGDRGGAVALGEGELGLVARGASHCCLTLFSCSKYSRAHPNCGATVTFDSDLRFDMNAWQGTGKSESGWWGNGSLDLKLDTGVEVEAMNKSLEVNLAETLIRHRVELEEALRKFDDSSGSTDFVVLVSDWASVMGRILGFGDREYWMTMLPIAVASKYIDTVESDNGGKADRGVRYATWLRGLGQGKVASSKRLSSANFEDALGSRSQSEKKLDCLYAHRRHLEAVFRYFDTDGSGTISREEFMRGCNVLVQQHALEAGDTEAMFDTLDIDSGGEIDINEFLECFRLINAKRDHTIRVTRHSLMLAEHQKAEAQNDQASEC